MSEPVSIRILPDGPIRVTGADRLHYCGAPLRASNDTVYLCRCGESTNPPFCDGSHARVGFSGASEVLDQRPSEGWAGESAGSGTRGADVDVVEGGAVRVRRDFRTDTPLLKRRKGRSAALCRCGLSKSKPWCDGRHRERHDFR